VRVNSKEYSLDCRQGHMKKNSSLSVCLCVCVKVKGERSKKYFLEKYRNLDIHAEGRSNGGRPCAPGLKKIFLLKVCLFVCDKLTRTSYDRKMFMEFVQYT
jgi:hypothetical protein